MRSAACALRYNYYEMRFSANRSPGAEETDVVHSRTLDAAFDDLVYGGDRWSLSARGAALGLPQTPSVFTVGNGFIGVRGPGDSGDTARVYLNGVFDETVIDYHEGAHGYTRSSDTRMAVADATQIDILVDDLPAPVTAIDLDFARGVRREVREKTGVTATIETLVSMRQRCVVALRVTLHATSAATVRVAHRVSPPPGGGRATETVYDPRVGPASRHNPWVVVRVIATDDVDGRVDRLDRSGFTVAALVSPLDGTIKLAAGESQTVDAVAVYCATRDGDPLPKARHTLAEAMAAGFDALAVDQANWFADHWRGAAVAFPDSAAAEQALRHGQFQVVQGVGRDGTTSIAAKGQSGEGYEGHVFWDAEIYALPMFVYTAPAIARAMLVWRIAGLDAARANARLMGHRTGALYPWRTIAGAECSAFFPAGAAQYHLNADIAYALRLYVDATGDTSILRDGGAAMIVETARVWLEIGFHDPARGGAFVINRVTGPDEYSALVNNNLYTNIMAAEHLRFAAAVGGVDHDEAARMRRAAEAIALAHDAERDIPAQDDGFFALAVWPFDRTEATDYPLLLHYHPLTIYRHRVAKQADAVLAAALLPGMFDQATKHRMLDAYEAVTVHDSTLSASAFAMLAAQAGEIDRAAAYWRASVLTDLLDLFGNSAHGLHMAALAGGWNALAFGFAGLRTIDGALGFAPYYVSDLGPYSLTFAFRERRIRIDVGAAEVRYALLAGGAITATHHGHPFPLEVDRPVVRPTTR